MPHQSEHLTIPAAGGHRLSGRLDLPDGPPAATCLFAHCFTCSKDVLAAARIARSLAERGLAVLRLDFTGLGSSEGDFAKTNFSTNVADLLAAVEYLRQHYQAPAILIGHSLGGTAVLAAAPHIPEAVAVATIAAPADAEHVLSHFHADLEQIEREGAATVSLAGRSFTIERHFIEDAKAQTVRTGLGSMRKALMVMHAPRDTVVGIENAGLIFEAARHPKSFISLDDADHLLSRREDAEYVAGVLAAWASRYLPAAPSATADTPAPRPAVTAPVETAPVEVVTVAERGDGPFAQQVVVGRHRLVADEPTSAGGTDAGPSPYDFLSIALGACTSMTLRMYATHKALPLEHVRVDVTHGKVHAKDCADCGEGRVGRIDRFERVITISGDLTPEQRARLLEIADRCPVHKTLSTGAAIVTRAGVGPE